MEDIIEESGNRRTFAWEGEYDRPWENLEVSAAGHLTLREDEGDIAAKRRRKVVQSSIKRRMLRSVLVVVDASKASAANDIKPTRLIACTNALIQFSKAFFDENPLSSMGVLCTRRGRVERLCEFTKSPKKVEDALMALQTNGAAEGSATLQNCLEWAVSMFRYVPDYVEREVLIVASAMSVVDPGDVFLTMKQLRERPSVRCSTIHLCGLVEVYKRLAEQTSGTFSVAMNVKHLQDLLAEQITPPPSLKDSFSMHMVQMGFPSQKLDDSLANSNAQPAYCLDSGQIVRAPYYCPRCSGAVSSLPATCRTCNLNLISSSHLARSHHHLFPVEPFEEVASGDGKQLVCFACEKGRPPTISETSTYFSRCGKCKSVFCRLCDDLIHDTLFVCPGCT